MPAAMIDYDSYPHIIDLIVRHSDHPTLLSWHATSRKLQSTADALLFHHVVFDIQPVPSDIAYHPYYAVAITLCPQGNRLPVFRNLLHPLYDDAVLCEAGAVALEQAEAVLAQTKIIDWMWPLDPNHAPRDNRTHSYWVEAVSSTPILQHFWTRRIRYSCISTARTPGSFHTVRRVPGAADVPMPPDDTDGVTWRSPGGTPRDPAAVSDGLTSITIPRQLDVHIAFVDYGDFSSDLPSRRLSVDPDRFAMRSVTSITCDPAVVLERSIPGIPAWKIRSAECTSEFVFHFIPVADADATHGDSDGDGVEENDVGEDEDEEVEEDEEEAQSSASSGTGLPVFEVPVTSFGVFTNLSTAVNKRPLATFTIVGAEILLETSVDPTDDDFVNTGTDWVRDRDILVQIISSSLDPGVAPPTFLTREEYRASVGEERWCLETVKPVRPHERDQ